MWDLVLHAAYWKFVVRRRLSGDRKARFAYDGKSFFAAADPTSAGLARDLALLDGEHRRLRRAVEDLRSITPASVRLIRGVAAHDLYHAGQIQLLKALRG